MGVMIENLGGIHGFLDLEIKCRKYAGVKSPTELMLEEALDKLIRSKLGYPELVTAEILSENCQLNLSLKISLSHQIWCKILCRTSKKLC